MTETVTEEQKIAIIQKNIQEARKRFDERKVDDEIDDPNSPTLPSLFGVGKAYSDQLEYLDTRPTYSVGFGDEHQGHILNTGGLVIARPEDELLFIAVTACDCTIVDMVDRETGQPMRAAMHTAPPAMNEYNKIVDFGRLPYYVKELQKQYDVQNVALLAHYESQVVAQTLQEEIEQPVELYDIPGEDRTVDIWVNNGEVRGKFIRYLTQAREIETTPTIGKKLPMPETITN